MLDVNGLYRRYDGIYVLMLNETTLIDMDEDGLTWLVNYKFLGQSSIYTEKKKDFFSSRYENVVFKEGIKSIEYRAIVDHPDNRTGQKSKHILVKNLENFGTNLSSEELYAELLKRKDSPIRDLDLGNEYCKDYVLGIACEAAEFNGRSLPRGVEVHSVCNSLEEAQKQFAEYTLQGKDRIKIFRRVFFEEN